MGQGALIAAATMTAFYIGLQTDAAVASTMAFATLTLARLFHGFNCRGKKNIFRLGFKSNPYSLAAFASGTLLLAIVIFVPFMHGLFSVADITTTAVWQIIGLAVLPTVVIQILKTLRKN